MTSCLARDGHAICSRADYGYGLQKNRRKVLLWSKEPWHRVDDLGIDTLPPGRFVSGDYADVAGRGGGGWDLHSVV